MVYRIKRFSGGEDKIEALIDNVTRATTVAKGLDTIQEKFGIDVMQKVKEGLKKRLEEREEEPKKPGSVMVTREEGEYEPHEETLGHSEIVLRRPKIHIQAPERKEE